MKRKTSINIDMYVHIVMHSIVTRLLHYVQEPGFKGPTKLDINH